MKQVTATNLVVQPENLMALHDFFLISKGRRQKKVVLLGVGGRWGVRGPTTTFSLQILDLWIFG